jgi:hypothetical protein
VPFNECRDLPTLYGRPATSACQTVKLALSLALWPLNWQLTVCVPVPLVVRVVVR